MRVLVVDDDPTAQRVMRLFLEKLSYLPEVHADGSKVLAVAQEENAPPIIILDWMLPGGLDGLALCRALRAARLRNRPYIIMFSSKNSGSDIAEALDAGADDFIAKPFNILQTQARLRVARRLVEYQRELLRQISDNETLSQRNSLLGEIIGRKPGAAREEKGKGKVDLPGKGVRQGANPVEFSLHDLRFLVSAALIDLRLALESVQTQTSLPSDERVSWQAWSGLVLVEAGLWLDLIVDLQEEMVGKLFRKSLGRDPRAEVELSVYLAEMSRAIAQGFSRTLAVRAGTVQQPLMARSLKVASRMIPLPIDCKSFLLSVDGVPLRLSLAFQNSSRLALHPRELLEGDILAEQYPQRSVSEVPLFREGVVLTPRFIERLSFYRESSMSEVRALVFRPSLLARYFDRSD